MRKVTRKAVSRARRIEAMDRWVEEVAQRVEEMDDEEQHAQLVHVRQQIDLLVQYQATCAKLQTFSKGLRDRGALLVPLRFPLRPTPRNRQSIEEGLTRSFKRASSPGGAAKGISRTAAATICSASVSAGYSLSVGSGR